LETKKVLIACDLHVRISSTFSVLRQLYLDSCTSNSVLRHFVKSGLLIGREVAVEVKFWSK